MEGGSLAAFNLDTDHERVLERMRCNGSDNALTVALMMHLSICQQPYSVDFKLC